MGFKASMSINYIAINTSSQENKRSFKTADNKKCLEFDTFFVLSNFHLQLQQVNIRQSGIKRS